VDDQRDGRVLVLHRCLRRWLGIERFERRR